MTNQITGITDEILTALREAGCRTVGILPEVLMFSGNNNPFGFIMLNSETTENDNGGILTQLLDISIFIITQNGINKMKEHCNVLYAAIGKILNSSGLNSKTALVNLETINWHADMPFVTQLVGDLDIISSINFNIKYMNAR
ncbi:MAG TPA: hypothetical protein PLZ47_08060 [Candidatus Cloacimonas acidaminovorans]|nr:hypothetical protein [Candidatus Cloacimonas acidaminovorans]